MTVLTGGWLTKSGVVRIGSRATSSITSLDETHGEIRISELDGITRHESMHSLGVYSSNCM